MSIITLNENGRHFIFFAQGTDVASAAKTVVRSLPPADPAPLADALLPAFLTNLSDAPKRAFVSVEGASAFHLERMQGFHAKDIGAGDVLIDGVLAVPHPCVPRGLVLGGRRSPLAHAGAADHIVVTARTAQAAENCAAEICAAVPDTQTYEAEESWNALSLGARHAAALRGEGKIYGAAITHKGRGRVVGALDPNPLFRLRVSDWR
ncbi:MAG: hypothetical protein ACPG1C_10205 [Alphaproteobacteria bacterium]